VSTWLVYDRDCGFCRWSLHKVLAWDRHNVLTPIALQDGAADRLLAPVPEHARSDSWHLVMPDGRVYSAGDAAAPLLRLLPCGRPLARLAASFPGPTNAAYRFVARHRSTLGRLLRARHRA
jgi:predicted DCC family thiol-disulfide oxidoreductase YuxK